ncbi:GNAT family N-acetyltransferase [Sulfurospirillum oryzae]|uniref:GNAT family N-acetyltransferase n=1 Tax=Sulfurospirillum oryzae TaxID=2976535 RepID=UPI0021E8FE5F|nr:GNAT family N-acetyltransferase [Sulfurospirillum oryzae]
MFVVEEAKLSDIERLIDLLTILFSQEAEFVPNRTLQQTGLQMILNDASIGTIFVLKSDQKIIGMVTLLWTISTALGGKVAFLEDMVVDPLWRGKGGGHALIEHAILYAEKLTCKRITLLTDTDNFKAHHFYQQFGFEASLMQPMRLLLTEK